MLSIVSAIPFLILIGWIALRRRFLFYFLLFTLIAFAWRLTSSIYIDAAGPVYADQLFRTIGGGGSSFVLVASQIVVLLAVLLVFSPARLKRLAGMRVEAGASFLSLSNGTFVGLIFGGVLLFLILLYADMARGGVIPMLAGIEEYVFTLRCAGILHRLLIRFGDHLTFYIGFLFVAPLLRGKKPDRRFLLLLVGILVYLLLASHRFSAFYRYTTFFLIPLGVVVLRKEFRGPPQAVQADAGSPDGRSYLPDVAVVAAAAIAMISFGTYRSLYFPVRTDCAVFAPVAAQPTPQQTPAPTPQPSPSPRVTPAPSPTPRPSPATSPTPATTPASGVTPAAPTPSPSRATSPAPSSAVAAAPAPTAPPVDPVATSSNRGGSLGYLRQRVLVVQGELWWLTYERIFLRGEFEPIRTFRRTFIDPVVPRRNSTIPYLMERAIGNRAYRILQSGGQYTGGFPEIFFELFGKVLAFPAIFLISLVMAGLMFKLVESVLLQRAVRTFLIFYVLYPFYLLPVIGMLNFPITWTYWLKVSALVAWLVLEQRVRDGRVRRAWSWIGS